MALSYKEYRDGMEQRNQRHNRHFGDDWFAFAGISIVPIILMLTIKPYKVS